MNATTIRALVLGALGIIGLFAPGLVPEGAKEAIADHATQAIGAVLALWSIFAGHRAVKQRQGAEP